MTLKLAKSQKSKIAIKQKQVKAKLPAENADI